MKKIFLFAAIIITATGIFISCKKEHSCEGCKGNKPPIAVAGPDQVITLPADSISLDGSASNDPDGKINVWLWKKISGPASFAIANSSVARTKAKNLVAGAYKFELTVTDNKGAFAKDTMMVTVDATQASNHPPIANAGADKTITLPTNSVTLDGSGSTDPDNNITTYQWNKISGPSSFNITNATATQTSISNLEQGVYQFELKVTDATGLFAKDTVNVTVNTQSTTSSECDNSNRPTVSAQLVPIGKLSEARAGAAVASAGSKILFAGSNTESSRVDIFDFVANTWSTAELSLGRAWIGATAAGNKIFLAGGQYNGWSYNAVDIYDVSTNQWTVSHLARGLNGADGLAAASTGNKVFFAGGNWGIYAVNTVDIYDLTTDSWSTAQLSMPRNFITAVSADNKVFFTGGDPWTGQMSDVIDVYDNTTSVWSTSTLQVPRSYLAAVAMNNVLYFAGGKISNNQFSCSVETLDATTGARSLMKLFSPASWFADAGQNAVVKDNKIIFLRHDGGGYAKKFDIYDTQSNIWLTGILPQAIPSDASVISVNNRIYIAGGTINGSLTNQVWELQF